MIKVKRYYIAEKASVVYKSIQISYIREPVRYTEKRNRDY